MRKELLIFASGLVVGAAIVALWPFRSIKPREPIAVSSITRNERPSPKRSSKIRSSAYVNRSPVSDTVVSSGNPLPATDGGQLPANTVSDPSPTPSIAEQYLDTRLQTALRTFRTTSDKLDRSVLAGEVVKLADTGVLKQQVAVALGTMLQEESSVEVKTDILDELGNLEDPAAFDQIIRELGQSQPQEVRIAAIDALDFLGDKRALPLLQQLLSDRDADIRDAAQATIDSLNSQ